jgi:hypothetical protein
MVGLDRQFCGFPSYNAASNLSNAVKAAALQQAGGDGRPMRQARQIELFENHGTPFLLADCYLGWGTIRR